MKILPHRKEIIEFLVNQNRNRSYDSWEDLLSRFPNWQYYLPLEFVYKSDYSVGIKKRILYKDLDNEVVCKVEYFEIISDEENN